MATLRVNAAPPPMTGSIFLTHEQVASISKITPVFSWDRIRSLGGDPGEKAAAASFATTLWDGFFRSWASSEVGVVMCLIVLSLDAT